MRYLRARLTQPAWMRHPMQEVLATSPAIRTEELHGWNLSHDAFQLLLFYVEGDPAVYRDHVDRLDDLRWYDISMIDEDRFYVYACEAYDESQLALFQPFAAAELIVIPPIVYDEEGRLELTIVGRGPGLVELVESIEAEGVLSIDVLHLGRFDRRYAGIVGEVSDRQYEALTTATRLGYYAVPRRASLANVADELDIAAGTASELLRRGESTVMAALLDAGTGSPAR